jgi:uncharacterized protein with PIN domain
MNEPTKTGRREMNANHEAGPASSRWRRRATFRFYEELNDFLPEQRRKVAFEHAFNGTPSVKDTVEALGVPHPEVDLILVDGVSVGFEHRLHGGERVAVYPVFERLDIAPLVRLRPEPLRTPRFVLDGHLGRLAKLLRLLGFDAVFDNEATDEHLAELARTGPRILLTRDKGLLKRGDVTHGYWLRSSEPQEQVREVVDSLDLAGACTPFSRCTICNTLLEEIEEPAVRESLPPLVQGQYSTIKRCPGCGRLYWPGTHYTKLEALVSSITCQRRMKMSQKRRLKMSHPPGE